MKKKIIPFIIVFALIMISGIGYGITRMIPSKKQMDMNKYYGETSDEEAVIILGKEILPDRAVVMGDNVYLPLAIVQNSLNKAFYWDSENQQILYAGPEELLEEPVSKEAGAKVLDNNGGIYLQADFVKEHSDIDTYYYKNPNRISIVYQWNDVKLVETTEDAAVRVQPGIKEDVLVNVPKGEMLWYINETEKWYQVAQKEGYIGYVLKKETDEPSVRTIERNIKEGYNYISMEEPVNLVWHQVTSEVANEGFDDATANVTGVNVISPTWFSLLDNSGTVSSIATQSYVDKAHAKGMKVWGLVDNFTNEVSTTEILSVTSSRRNVINQLIEYALQYDLDGINIDFEQLSEDVGPHFLQFLRELSIETHKNNLVLSVDNPVPEDFTSHYDRKEQGRVVDYLIIMGYDEHYVGSDAGSVASLPWVEKGIQQTLEEAPASRTINAIPFYCRVWRKTAGQLESDAIGMDDAQEVLSVHKVETYWDNDAGQNHGTYEDSAGNSCEIWVEDNESIAQKVQLVKKYQLAGVAEWKLGLETQSVWQTITENLS